MRAAVYTRISQDATGQRAGVTRQLEDCEALADRLGWEVTHRYGDNDLSAYSGRTRPRLRGHAEVRFTTDLGDPAARTSCDLRGRATILPQWHRACRGRLHSLPAARPASAQRWRPSWWTGGPRFGSFERAVAEVVQQSGRIDYLFNNAGIGVGGEVDSYTLDDWNDVFDVNLRGVIHGIQAVYPIMIRQHSGYIVNTASMAGLVTSAGTASYTATKHAVVGLSKVLRVEAERHGVQVSVFCPGAIRTPILTMGKYGRYDGVSDEQLLKFWEPFRPMAPEKFAERALRAVLRGDAIIVVPAWWKALWYLERLSPALSMRVAKVSLKHLRGLESTTS
jgi:NAD(P)-dependent dehydrogenase (short-subunit alcohol dehydrogenase family)